MPPPSPSASLSASLALCVLLVAAATYVAAAATGGERQPCSCRPGSDHPPCCVEGLFNSYFDPPAGKGDEQLCLCLREPEVRRRLQRRLSPCALPSRMPLPCPLWHDAHSAACTSVHTAGCYPLPRYLLQQQRAACRFDSHLMHNVCRGAASHTVAAYTQGLVLSVRVPSTSALARNSPTRMRQATGQSADWAIGRED